MRDSDWMREEHEDEEFAKARRAEDVIAELRKRAMRSRERASAAARKSPMSLSPLALLLPIFVLVGIELIWSPHWMGHEWTWTGDGENFDRDYGESRAAAKQSDWLVGTTVDRRTFHALMRGRGWRLTCEECGEER